MLNHSPACEQIFQPTLDKRCPYCANARAQKAQREKKENEMKQKQDRKKLKLPNPDSKDTGKAVKKKTGKPT